MENHTDPDGSPGAPALAETSYLAPQHRVVPERHMCIPLAGTQQAIDGPKPRKFKVQGGFVALSIVPAVSTSGIPPMSSLLCWALLRHF